MSIFTNEYKFNFGKKYTWLIFILILATMFILAFPIINDPSIKPIIDKNIDNLSPKIVSVFFPFGIELFNDIDIFYNSILVGINILLAIFAMSVGLNSLAREQGYGTIDYLYINPIERTDIVINKFIADFINLLILVILLQFATSYLYSYVAKTEFLEIFKNQFEKFLILFTNAILFLSIGMFISSFNKRISNLGGVNFLIIVTFIVLNIIISLKIIEFSYEKFVPFRTIVSMINSNIIEIAITVMICKILPAIIFMILANIIYNKKDFII